MSNDSLIIVDKTSDFLKELTQLFNLSQSNLENKILPEINFNWVYFPWRNSIAKIPDRENFIRLRTNRNQLKIKQEEQEALSKKTILCIGQSVGKTAAITLAMQRTCGKMIIADFDTLSLSNMNRLQASVLDIGKPKVQITAEQIWELDPYFELVIESQGITAGNIHRILEEHQVDLIIEECDSLPIKLLTRQVAKQKRIPVVMETSDKGMLDVERYDLDADYPIFHGKLNKYFDVKLDTNNPEIKMNILKDLLDYDNISARLKESGQAMGKTIVAFPQLAQEVMLGGALISKISKRILLKRTANSGRYYLDSDALFDAQ